MACTPCPFISNTGVFSVMEGKATYSQLKKRLREIEVDLRRMRAQDRHGKGNGNRKTLWGNQNRFRHLFKNSSLGMAIVGLDGTFLEVNPSLCKLFGYSGAELLQKNVKDITHPSDLEPESHLHLQELNGVQPRIWLEQRYWHKNGATVYGLVSGSVVRDKNDEPLYIITHVQDITSRKKAEAQLRESEERYRIALEHSNDGFVLTHRGRLMFFNRRFLDIFGYTNKAQLIGKPMGMIIHPDDRAKVLERYRKRFEGKRVPDRYEFKGVRCDGELVWVEISSANSTYRGKPVNLAFFRDNTARIKLENERQELQERLQHVQKMEAIGTLAGGIAHEFNNILMAIQGRASLMRMDMIPDHPHYQQLDEVERNVKRASRLTRQILGFAQGGKYDIKPTNLNRLISTSLRMFGNSRKEITIRTDLKEPLWVVEVDQGQMEQALLNIFVNAWQAMPQGGTLLVETSNTELDENIVEPYELPPGRYVKIIITDTGIGMNGDVLRRIFDPFFTTKKEESSIGMGLSSTYGIIKNHNGIIQTESRKGEGSVFTVYLPAATKVAALEPRRFGKIVPGEETILVVDDEPTVLRVAEEMLKRIGYTILTAENGAKAIACYREKQEEIDLVMLDMIMPELDGGETFDRLREIDPTVKVLLSSGFSLDGQASDIMKRGCNGFIQKPFDLRELSSKVHEVLVGHEN